MDSLVVSEVGIHERVSGTGMATYASRHIDLPATIVKQTDWNLLTW
jgi:hypothetical protein